MEGKFDVGENCQVTSLNREGKEVGLSAQEDRHFVPSKRAQMAIGQSSQKERPFLVFCFDEKMEWREGGGVGLEI